MINQQWLVGGRTIDLSQRALVMGILNVTPDSFSDGGQLADAETAIARGIAMVGEGADVLDVGGESTRPGAAPVSEADERERVLPVIEGLRAALGDHVLISIDTMKAGVAHAALEAGADIVNDVTALTGDPEMAGVVAKSECGVVVMHMQGEPRTMQADPIYEDVVKEVGSYLADRVGSLGSVGIAPERILIDPGIGFGKTLEHNLALLRALPEIATAANRPILLGVSRKAFIGILCHGAPPEDRLWGTVALTAHACQEGVAVVRVHDVRENVEALRMTEAIYSLAE
ncbi:dihydropteroate synthase [Verrucomicrobiales bacterium]|nr:dihydropteroate synthase [Verrucomicrobiales bacterium]